MSLAHQRTVTVRAAVAFAVLALTSPTLTAQPPRPRDSHAMVTAGPSGGVLLFGGGASNSPRLVDTLWTWTGTTWRMLSDGGPRSRLWPMGAYDTRRGVFVLYGGAGIGSGTLFGDTWEWDGRKWEEKNVRSPGPRDHHAMAYDEARGKIVVYGGRVDASLVGGTWTWDGTTWTKADSATGPGPAGHHAMAYDSKRQRVVMYGGIPNNGPRMSDTWEWDGTRWERVATEGSPGPRSHHRMAYDAARGVIVLFGGGDSTSTETWTYDGRKWERHLVAGPPARWSSAMAYDAGRQRVVLFGGGRNGRPFGSLGDTWEWDGARWEQRQAMAQSRPAMRGPSGLTLDSAGNVFVADRAAHVVFRIDARTNDMTVFAGTGVAGYSGDGGLALSALFRNPEWVEFDVRGNLYVADRGNHVIRKIDRSGVITHVAGTGVQGQSGDGGLAATAVMTNPFGFTLDRAGNLFFFDTEVHAIRRIDARTGIVTTVVGNKQRGFSGDGGPATQAMLYRPHNGVFDRDGALIFGDSFNNRIRRWDPSTGIIETIAGTGELGTTPDGTPARQAKFTFFGGMVVDRNGDLLVTGLDHRIFKLDRRAGVIRNVAGTGVAGFSGDGGPARTAQFAGPYGLAITPNGDLVVADPGNARVRRIDASTGVIRTIAGPGAWNTSVQCAATSQLAGMARAAKNAAAREHSSAVATPNGRNDLTPGTYQVGFTVTVGRDDTRLCRAGSETLGVPLTVAYWYPARGSTTPAATRATTTVLDAPAANGSFPIVVGMGTAATSSVLAEYLASHGYVVALVRPTIDYAMTPAQRVDAGARDIDFARRQLSRLPFADTTRVATWGTPATATPALMAAIQTRGVGAVVSLAGTTFQSREASTLGETPLSDAGALRVPLLYLTRAGSVEAAEQRQVEALRYSARVRLSLDDTTLTRAQRATAEYVRHFLDANLRQDAAATAWLARSPEQNGFAPGVTVARYDSRVPAPTPPQFTASVRNENAATAIARFHELRRADPEATLFQEATINAMGYQLIGANAPVAIELFRANVELYPRSTNTWDSLSEAYETTGDTARAIEFAQKAFDVAPNDASLAPTRREQLRGIASDRMQRLRRSTPPPPSRP